MLSKTPAVDPVRTNLGGRIVLVTASPELRQRVHAATGGAFLVLSGPLPADPADLFRQLGPVPPPEVVVLDPLPADTDHALRLAASLDEHFPGISVILISEFGAEVALSALRAGVRDVLHPTADDHELSAALGSAVLAARTRPPDPAALGPAGWPPAGTGGGRVISVVSPKGGVGKTTLSTNLAVGLAKAAPHSTVLVDLDVQFGDVATALSLAPEYSLPDAVRGSASRDTMLLKTFLSMHSTGLSVLCGPDSPIDADAVTGDAVGALLHSLASEFRYVVVDTAPGLSEHTLAAMDHSTDLVLVTSMDVPGVRGLRKELDTLTQLGMAPIGRQVVLNFAERRGGLSTADVALTLGTGIDVVLPRSMAVTASVNQGIPLLQNGGRDPIIKQLEMLVSHFAPPLPAAPGRRRGRHHKGRR